MGVFAIFPYIVDFIGAPVAQRCMSAPAAAVLSSSRECPKAESRAHFCAAEANVFWCALVSFIIVFAPAWWPLLKPPPKIPGPFLHPEMWQQLPLVGKEKLSHNARRFRCLLYKQYR